MAFQQYQHRGTIKSDLIATNKKKNGYVADHIKFEMMRNKMRTFEMQITSKAVALISKGKRPQRANTILKEKEVGGLTLPDLRLSMKLHNEDVGYWLFLRYILQEVCLHSIPAHDFH